MTEVIYKPLFDGLEVSYDGQFRRNGKPHRVIYSHTVTGKKATARLMYSKNNKMHYYQAAKLVAMAWKPKYKDGCNIIYKDEDIHNIHADNLIIVGDKDWWSYMMRNSGYHGASIDERKLKLDMKLWYQAESTKIMQNVCTRKAEYWRKKYEELKAQMPEDEQKEEGNC